MIEAFYAFLQKIGFSHPLHPPLTHLPMGLVTESFLFALMALFFAKPVLLTTARHCSLLALVFALPTGVAGYFDWVYRYGGSMERAIQIKLVLAPLLFIVLTVAAWQSRKPASAKTMCFLYGCALLCAIGLGFFVSVMNYVL